MGLPLDQEILAQQETSSVPKYMILLNKLPLNDEHECTTFFNETYICFVNEWPKNMYYYGSEVLEIELNTEVSAYACRQNSRYNLEFISECRPRRKQNYIHRYDEPQHPTTVYVIDSYLDVNHPEFEGRASKGPSFNHGDQDGHGTHVAGIIAGKQFGVNKKAKIIGVQVLDNNARGSWSTIVRGIEWVASQRPTIVNLSIGGGVSSIVDKAIAAMAKRGWKIVIAAGNEHNDACDHSPARAKEGVTVGATNEDHQLAGFSNFGRCVDILAPGDAIVSAIPRNRYAYMSGTSMAAPMVAGVWSLFPDWSKQDLLDNTQKGNVGKVPQFTPNKFLYQPTRQQCLLEDVPFFFYK